MTSTWILGFDTATRATAVALVGPEEIALEARDDPPRGARPRHVTRLLPLCTELLEEAGIRFADLDRLAVGVGPGTFTGLRIGVATARALARASAAPLIGVSTLKSLALGALSDPAADTTEAMAAVLDARRGEVFAAVWRTEELARFGEPLVAEGAFTPASLASRLSGLELPVLAFGEGAIEFRLDLERSGAVVPEDEAALHRVTAVGHCQIARHLPGVDPEQIRPEYLRLPDAEIARRAKGNQ